MAKIISIFNQKGGVGKTTTSINLSAALGKLNYKILLLDLDPQGNASSGLGVNFRELDILIYDVLARGGKIKDSIVRSSAENVDIIASNSDLAGLEIELARSDSWDRLLDKKLKRLEDDYNFIFIDCPPSLGILSILALTSSDSLIIPIQCEYYALEGVSQLFNTVQLIKERLNPNLELEGVVLSMFDGRTNLSIEVVEEVKKHFKSKVYTSIIPRNVRLAEAPSHGKSIIDYDIRSKGAKAYMSLAEEFIEELQR